MAAFLLGLSIVSISVEGCLAMDDPDGVKTPAVAVPDVLSDAKSPELISDKFITLLSSSLYRDCGEMWESGVSSGDIAVKLYILAPYELADSTGDLMSDD